MTERIKSVSVSKLLTKSINDTDCRTAWTTPGLVNTLMTTLTCHLILFYLE